MKNPDPRLASQTDRNISWWFLAAFALLWVAFYNRYPLVFPDTSGYLAGSLFRGAIWPYRSPGYSVFIRLVSFGAGPWLIIIAQSLIASFVLYQVFDYLAPMPENPGSRKFLFAAMVAFMAAATSLPWHVSQVMPDVFTSLLFLSLFLLLYDDALPTWKRVFLSAVFAVSVGAHLSHIPLAALLVAMLLAARAVARLRWLWWPASPKQVLAGVLVPALLACLGVCAINQREGVGFTLAPAQGSFLFGRLLSSGLAERYLRTHCASEHFAACARLNDLPHTEETFLWGSDPLLKEMGGVRSAEADRIVHGVIRQYPIAFAAECLRQAFRQFAAIKTGDTVTPYHLDSTGNVISLMFPAQRNAYSNSAQLRGLLLRLAKRVSPLHVAVFWLCLGGNLLLVFSADHLNRLRQFFCLVLLMLVCNALITSSLAGVFDRYQGRVAWLVPFSFVLYAGVYVRERLDAAASDESSPSDLETIAVAD